MIDNWKSLPMGKYLDILKVASEDSEDIDKQIKYIAILADIAEDDVLAMPITEYAKYADRTLFLLKPADKEAGRVTDRVVLDGHKYRLTTDYRQITTAQYIDFQTLSKDANDHIVELISVFLIPEGKTYNDGYDILDVQKDIRLHLSVPVANALIAFFLQRLRISIRAMLISLAWMSRWNRTRLKMIRKVRRNLRTASIRNGDGLHR